MCAMTSRQKRKCLPDVWWLYQKTWKNVPKGSEIWLTRTIDIWKWHQSSDKIWYNLISFQCFTREKTFYFYMQIEINT